MFKKRVTDYFKGALKLVFKPESYENWEEFSLDINGEEDGIVLESGKGYLILNPFALKPGDGRKIIIKSPNGDLSHWLHPEYYHQHFVGSAVEPIFFSPIPIQRTPVKMNRHPYLMHRHSFLDILTGEVVLAYCREDCSICKAVEIAKNPWWKRMLWKGARTR